ncbi:MAG: hypothetical protein ACLP59_22985 [Bryobacteraceae bacterium]
MIYAADHVKNRTFKEMLTGTGRFRIPFVQRGYAWKKKQWDQLFLDLQEQVIDELATGATIDEVEFGGRLASRTPKSREDAGLANQTGVPVSQAFLARSYQYNNDDRE